MTSQEPARSEDERWKSPGNSSDGRWSVNPEIWARGAGPPRGFLTNFARRSRDLVTGVLFSPVSLVMFGAPAILFAGAVAVFVAYRLGGVAFFGPILMGFLASIVLLMVFAIEKMGYARNFEGWDFPLRRVLYVPVAFALLMGMLYFLILLSKLPH